MCFSKEAVLPLVYAEVAALEVFGVYMGIFILPDSMAVSFIALQLLVSLVLLDRAWRVNLLLVSASVFRVLSFAMRKFMGVNFAEEQVPDATTLLQFRHLLENNGLAEKIFGQVKGKLEEICSSLSL